MSDRGLIGFLSDDPRECIFLYAHDGGRELDSMVMTAIRAARPRWGDASYATRMALTALIGGVEGDRGYGVSTVVTHVFRDVRIIDWEQQIVYKVPAEQMATYWHLRETRIGILSMALDRALTFGQLLDMEAAR